MTIQQQRFQTTVLGSPVAAWRYGDPGGELLILVHGFRGDHHGLELIAERLAVRAPELCVIVPDLPGFGATPQIPDREHTLNLYGEWLSAFTASVAGDHRYAIIGHSFGSLVVSCALQHGLSPEATVLLNPISSPALTGPNRMMTQLAIAYYQLADVLPERAARTLLSHPAIVRVMSETMAKTRDAPLRAWIHREHAAHFSTFADPRTLLEAFRASVSHTVAEASHAFRTPTLLVAGDRDDITPLTEQLALHRRIPDSQLRIVSGVGHLVHYEAVEESVAHIHEFLSALQPTDATHVGEGTRTAGESNA